MGTICSKLTQKTPQNYSRKSNKITSQIHNAESEKVAQIKQFLTLTSQNTQNFYQHKTTSPQPQSKNLKPKLITDFKVVRGLGRGAFGQVFMVKEQDENKFYAMKIILKQSITSSEEKISTLSQRLILEAMDHPFIVKLHYAFQSERKLYLLCDLMAGGQLFYLLRRSKKFPEQIAKFYAAEILLALEYLHSRNIIYRDLKPENILLDQQGHLKITDFGLSKVRSNQHQLAFSICGTPQYIAPEIMLGKGYTHTADWFSFGSLLYDMLTGKPPFYSSNKAEIIKKVSTKPVPIPEDLSIEAKSLLKGLFKIKPKERLGNFGGSNQIKKHQFFSTINFQKVLKRQINPPISFKQALNDDGFDLDFNNNHSYQSTMNLDRTIKQKGVRFDGFTYYKPEMSPRKVDNNGHKDTQDLLRQISEVSPPISDDE